MREMSQETERIIQTLDGLNVIAQTLGYDKDATADYRDGQITLGIPQGIPGVQPEIIDGYWYIWNGERYVYTGVAASGVEVVRP